MLVGFQHATFDAPWSHGLPCNWGHCHPADTDDTDSWYCQEIQQRQEM